MSYVYFCVRRRYFQFRTSCDIGSEKLLLKYNAERKRFYVSLNVEKSSDELFGGKKSH